MLSVNFFHQYGVTSSQVGKLISNFIKIVLTFFDHGSYIDGIDISHHTKQFQCMWATNHEILENIIDETHLILNHSMNNRSHTADSLPANAKSYKKALTDEAMKEIPI